MSTNMFHLTKFKISGTNKTKKENEHLNIENLPFLPKYETKLLFNEAVRVSWFEIGFCQSKYSYDDSINGSNACTLIAVITAAISHFNNIQIEGPEKPVNEKLILALAYGMLLGNSIHQNLTAQGVLSNMNLTVPQSLKYAGHHVSGIKEWKSELHPYPLQDSLYQNLRGQWRKWHRYCALKKKCITNLYVILISDSRSVLFIFHQVYDTVTLVDSHRHSSNKGALIATVNRTQLKLLCQWFGDITFRCYHSSPEIYELSFLYFRED